MAIMALLLVCAGTCVSIVDPSGRGGLSVTWVGFGMSMMGSACEAVSNPFVQAFLLLTFSPSCLLNCAATRPHSPSADPACHDGSSPLGLQDGRSRKHLLPRPGGIPPTSKHSPSPPPYWSTPPFTQPPFVECSAPNCDPFVAIPTRPCRRAPAAYSSPGAS